MASPDAKTSEFTSNAVRMESRKSSVTSIEVPVPERGEIRSLLSGELSPSPSAAGGVTTGGASASAQGALPDLGHDLPSRSASRLVITPYYAAAQWQNVAEGFAALLQPEFVDLIFKVRGKQQYLAAHRSLIAAAWPSLREDLAKLTAIPPHEHRKAALKWTEVESNPEERLSPTAMDNTSLPGPPAEVVFDVTSKQWGSYAIVRALLCHLYSRPVTVLERELAVLRVAATALGLSELARSCDDMEEKPIKQAWGGSGILAGTGASRSSTPDFVNAGDARSDKDKSLPAIILPSQEDYTSVGKMPPGKALQRTTSRDKESENSPRESPPPPTTSAKYLHPPDYSGKSTFTGEARALPMAERSKPRGERSFSNAPEQKSIGGTVEDTASTSEPNKGSVHRVLSEIKRNIVESSRIIADKTFQQIYEMVPGTRGVLGEGINGPVRMARNRKTGREVAVKRISCVNLSEQRRQMLVSEVRIFLQVSHRNIVQLLEVYESEVDQAVLLVMELCTGRELFERLADRRWYSEFDAARVTRQMLDAVSYLHSQNICHRDLKLENWLYESPSHDAKLKLCDFGFGQIVDPNVQLTATLGSLFYVAPEVLEGSYGLPCDMWSLGVIVYMLLSGVPPFDGKTDVEVINKIRQGRYVSSGKRWEGISETAKHFVRSMLRKDPYERLTAAEVAQHAWLKMDCQPKLVSNPHLWARSGADPELESPIDREVIHDMWTFAQNNAVTRAALGLLAKIHGKTSFSGKEQDVLLLEQRFKSYDEQGTGKIDAESFIKVLKETLHLQISSAEEKQFFERIAGNIPATTPEEAQMAENKDKDKDHQKDKTRRRRAVNYAEFITLTKARRMANNTAAIREAFRTFDTTGDGYVKGDDMHKFLGDEYKTTIEQYMDVNNGKDIIDYLHFANILSQEMAKKQERGDPEGQALLKSIPPILDIGTLTRAATAPSTVNTPHAGQSDFAAIRTRSGDSIVSPSPMEAPEVSDLSDRYQELAIGSADAIETKATKANEDQENEEEEEECEADDQSDEEQLLNVVNSADDEQAVAEQSDTAQVGEEEDKKREKPHKRELEKKEARFQSFSLSLAGSSEYDDVPVGVNRVVSMPSDKYSIKQLPGFHSRTLKPFYSSRPVSNIVLGLIRGTSLYAKQSVAAKLATIIHTACGWFFIMPNPKYHTEVDSRKGLLSKETGKFRFVAWWIHPRFVPQCRQWFERMTGGKENESHSSNREGGSTGTGNKASTAGGEERGSFSGNDFAKVGTSHGMQEGVTPEALPHGLGSGKNLEPDLGSPGDFRFSDVPKPENYLHTYRDLHTRVHVDMLGQLWEGTHRFLRSLFDENFMAHASISAGFHYPVRTQYATLHMQVRVNAGNICGEDGRGMEVGQLIDTLKRDRMAFERDSEPVKYQVTENVKVSLLAAASEYEQQNPGESACRQVTPFSFELGAAAMPTIHDEGEEDEEDQQGHRRSSHGTTENAEKTEDTKDDDDNRDSQIAANHEVADEVPASYLINIQPSVGSKFSDLIYSNRQKAADEFGADPTYLYPLHVSVTGFFEASEGQIRKLKAIIPEMLARELKETGGVKVGDVICTKTGYVLYDMKASAITNFAQRLGDVSARQYGLHIRPKAVNHISLACNRPDESIREKIKSLFVVDEAKDDEESRSMREIYETAEFDLVVSRLLARSSFERFAEDGPHQFQEVIRIPLSQPDKIVS